MTSLARSAEFARLLDLAERTAATSLQARFEADPLRGERLCLEVNGLLFDFSKQLVDSEILEALAALARSSGLEASRDQLFAGEIVNTSEQRPALHVQQRAEGAPGLDLVRSFVRALRRGDVLGATGRPLRRLVNLGIGGSDLGPRMARAALEHLDDGVIEVRFASSLDPAGFQRAVDGLDPAETLFVVATKSFSTLETGVLAHRAVEWLKSSLGEGVSIADHLVTITGKPELAARSGIAAERTFLIDEGIGGRYSLSSAMGLSVMAAVGVPAFDALLQGFGDMDRHFAEAALEENLPVLHGLLAFWNRTVLELPAVAVIPYADGLRLLPEHLAQLLMESNGKSVTRSGEHVSTPTSPVLFGAPGTDAQHSFFQLLHQGTMAVPVDFIAVASGPQGPHDVALANLLAQAQALAFGQSAAELEATGTPHDLAVAKAMPGNRPSSILAIAQLTPYLLGGLVALYEHSVFVQATLLDINPFDQFGVERGKELAASLAPQLRGEGPAPEGQDSSTAGRVAWLRSHRE